MALSDIAGRLLKGAGHSQPPPSKDQIPGLHLTPHRTAAAFPAAPTQDDASQILNCGGMVGCHIGEPRGHSVANSWAKPRPLSDIREVTESSIADTLPRNLLANSVHRGTSRTEMSPKPSAASRRRPSNDTQHGENVDPSRKNSVESNGLRCIHRGRSSRTPSPPNIADDDSKNSIYSIPASTVPPRSSSRSRAHSASRPRQPQQATPMNMIPATATKTPSAVQNRPPSPPKTRTNVIPNCGHSHSPIRHIAARLDPITHDTNRRIPSKTFVREPLSKEILEFPSHRHPRIELGLDLSAGIFVGGGSIEGTVQINIDDAE